MYSRLTWRGTEMEQTHLVHPSAFCWNPSCTDYGQVNRGTIRRFGRTQAGTQRYQCRTCGSTFVETIGTVFYGRHHTQETILECLALLPNATAWLPFIASKASKKRPSWTGYAWQPIMSNASRRSCWPTSSSHGPNSTPCGPMSATRAKKGALGGGPAWHILARHHYRERLAPASRPSDRQD